MGRTLCLMQPKFRGSLRRILFGGSLSPAVTQESWTQKQVAHGDDRQKTIVLGRIQKVVGTAFINFGNQMLASLYVASR